MMKVLIMYLLSCVGACGIFSNNSYLEERVHCLYNPDDIKELMYSKNPEEKDIFRDETYYRKINSNKLSTGYQNSEKIFKRTNNFFEYDKLTKIEYFPSNVSETLNKSKSIRIYDQDGVWSPNLRFKRYVLSGHKWEKNTLKWALLKDSSRNPELNYRLEDELEKSLKAWSKYSNLDFVKVDRNDKVDLKIKFFAGSHGDDYRFDGKGGTLAHAFYPIGEMKGEIHFDDDENFVLNDLYDPSNHDTVNAMHVFIHEIGHSLGIKHSDDDESIMRSFYKPEKSVNLFDLSYDDRYAIQALYGAPYEKPPEEETTTTPAPVYTTQSYKTTPKRIPIPTRPPEGKKPDICSTSITAITTFRMEIWIMKDNYIWRIKKYNGKTANRDAPHFISDIFNELDPEAPIDAAFDTKDSKLFLFSGKNYFIIKPHTIEKKGTLEDLGLKNISKVDAAMRWQYNGRVYIFSGHQYWRMTNDKIDIDYPRDIVVWRGLPESVTISAILTKKGSGYTYFFSGNIFWIFDNLKMRVTSPPLSISSFWVACSDIRTNARWNSSEKLENNSKFFILVFQIFYYYKIS